MKNIASYIGMFGISSLLTGCALAPGQHFYLQSKNNPPKAVSAKVNLVRIDVSLPHRAPNLFNTYAYRMGPEDILNITVWDHPELTIPAGQFRSPTESGIEVDARGDIFYPFVGQLHVAGLTVGQARVRLTERLKAYIKNPQISVRVADYNSQKVQVIGSVKTPQTLKISSVPMSLMDAINQAGGFNPLAANTQYVYLVRPAPSVPFVFEMNADDPTAVLVANKLYLHANDIVYVSTAGLVNWSKFINNLLPSLGAVYTAHQISGW